MVPGRNQVDGVGLLHRISEQVLVLQRILSAGSFTFIFRNRDSEPGAARALVSKYRRRGCEESVHAFAQPRDIATTASARRTIHRRGFH
jgi:hypothetical protein